MESTGLHFNPGPTAYLYLLCDRRQAASPLRVSVASLAGKDGEALRGALGTSADTLKAPNTRPSINSGISFELPV